MICFLFCLSLFVFYCVVVFTYLLSPQRCFLVLSYFSSMKHTLWGFFFSSGFSSLLTLFLTLLWDVKCRSCHFLFHYWADKRQFFAAYALDMESNKNLDFLQLKMFLVVRVLLHLQYFSSESAETATVFHISRNLKY